GQTDRDEQASVQSRPHRFLLNRKWLADDRQTLKGYAPAWVAHIRPPQRCQGPIASGMACQRDSHSASGHLNSLFLVVSAINSGSNGRGMTKVVIIGGGPAGLTAAYELGKARVPCTVLEKDLVLGGIARTVCHNGYLFDIGGHRFFTKVAAAEQMWREVLGDDFIRCRRLSRIYYNKRFFHYPLQLGDTLIGLGLWNSALILGSYIWARLFPTRSEETFEDWICNRFGRRVYRTFFKTYTEKVWGIPCNQIGAEWAAQRIKGLSLFEAVKHALLKQAGRRPGRTVKTLIDSFHYPRQGPGMMWNTVGALVEKEGNTI